MARATRSLVGALLSLGGGVSAVTGFGWCGQDHHAEPKQWRPERRDGRKTAARERSPVGGLP